MNVINLLEMYMNDKDKELLAYADSGAAYFVLWYSKSKNEFVTHELTANGLFGGHYFGTDEVTARKDFCKRVNLKYMNGKE